jgi:hypothetical protein
MAECANCGGSRIQDDQCLECGLQTAEKKQANETSARSRPARKTTAEKR